MTASPHPLPAAETGERSGADVVVATLAAAGVDTCFVNPGTSELHFMAVLGRGGGLRSIPCLTESVATGAADGHGRMAGKPAAVLLHCGPGLANGLANLHNARRACTPVVVLVGDHATGHETLDPPLASDAVALAHTVSKFVRRAADPASLAADVADAVAASRSAPAGVATLVVPSDLSWSAAACEPVSGVLPCPPRRTSATALRQAVRILRRGRAAILLGGPALSGRCVELAARIADNTGNRLIAAAQVSRVDRGRGRPALPRLAYDVDEAAAMLDGAEAVLLFGTTAPVAFFALPGRRQTPIPDGVRVLKTTAPDQDAEVALETLAHMLECNAYHLPATGKPELPRDARLDAAMLAHVLAAVLPAEAIVVDESVSLGRAVFNATASAARHDWLQLTGGAIGSGIPMATGAAVAASGRSVISLQADGAGLYTLQGLWTQAREKLPVTTIVLSNRSYAILLAEARRMGIDAAGALGEACRLDDPPVGWPALAAGFGVPAATAGTVAELARHLRASSDRAGPFLIEADFTQSSRSNGAVNP